jgi:hypothetical protein
MLNAHFQAASAAGGMVANFAPTADRLSGCDLWLVVSLYLMRIGIIKPVRPGNTSKIRKKYFPFIHSSLYSS